MPEVTTVSADRAATEPKKDTRRSQELELLNRPTRPAASTPGQSFHGGGEAQKGGAGLGMRNKERGGTGDGDRGEDIEAPHKDVTCGRAEEDPEPAGEENALIALVVAQQEGEEGGIDKQRHDGKADVEHAAVPTSKPT